MNLENRMAGIDANLDDLQAGLEASCRAADVLHKESATLEKILKRIKNVPLIGSLVRHAANVQVCARDQREALGELREGFLRLQQELKRSNSVRPPLVVAAAQEKV